MFGDEELNSSVSLPIIALELCITGATQADDPTCGQYSLSEGLSSLQRWLRVALWLCLAPSCVLLCVLNLVMPHLDVQLDPPRPAMT